MPGVSPISIQKQSVALQDYLTSITFWHRTLSRILQIHLFYVVFIIIWEQVISVSFSTIFLLKEVWKQVRLTLYLAYEKANDYNLVASVTSNASNVCLFFSAFYFMKGEGHPRNVSGTVAAHSVRWME